MRQGSSPHKRRRTPRWIAARVRWCRPRRCQAGNTPPARPTSRPGAAPHWSAPAQPDSHSSWSAPRSPPAAPASRWQPADRAPPVPARRSRRSSAPPTETPRPRPAPRHRHPAPRNGTAPALPCNPARRAPRLDRRRQRPASSQAATVRSATSIPFRRTRG